MDDRVRHPLGKITRVAAVGVLDVDCAKRGDPAGEHAAVRTGDVHDVTDAENVQPIGT